MTKKEIAIIIITLTLTAIVTLALFLMMNTKPTTAEVEQLNNWSLLFAQQQRLNNALMLP